MDGYIEREALYEKAYWHGEHPDVGNPFPDGVDAIDIKDVDAIPAADVAPVVHAHWDDSGRYTFPGGSTAVRCTNCGCALTVSEYRLNNWNYCPVCGAKMDGGDSDEAD